MNPAHGNVPSLKSLFQRPADQIASDTVSGTEPLFAYLNPQFCSLLNSGALQDIAALSNAFAGADCFPVLPNRLKKRGYGGGSAIDPKDAALFFDMGASIWVKNLRRLAPFHEVETLWADDLGLPAPPCPSLWPVDPWPAPALQPAERMLGTDGLRGRSSPLFYHGTCGRA